MIYIDPSVASHKNTRNVAAGLVYDNRKIS